MIYLNADLQRLWQGRDPFAMVDSIDGKVYRKVKNRRTLQFMLDGKSYFLKQHKGAGWAEIIKNLVQLRMPVLGASNEWVALNKLQELGVDTMEVAAYGIKGSNPANLQSFIITLELTQTISLEDYCKAWPHQKPQTKLKHNLIRQLALTSKTLHHNNICHRDFYLCHFLLHTSTLDQKLDPKLSLIDLHRALVKTSLGRRWVEKDLVGLYFSALDIGLTQRDLFRFMKIYSSNSLRDCLQRDGRFWSRVDSRARQMYQRLLG